MGWLSSHRWRDYWFSSGQMWRDISGLMWRDYWSSQMWQDYCGLIIKSPLTRLLIVYVILFLSNTNDVGHLSGHVWQDINCYQVNVDKTFVSIELNMTSVVIEILVLSSHCWRDCYQVIVDEILVVIKLNMTSVVIGSIY